MNKEDNLPPGEGEVPNEQAPQEQPENEVAKADAAKDEEISSTGPIAKTEQAAIFNLQTEKDMEVHHHPDLHHKKKNFKEYFLEFLMIFLAVTMGFFAESLREHIKSNDEIHEDIQSILADLKSDVAHFDGVMNVNTYSYTLADSLVNLLHNDLSNTPLIYSYARGVTANVDYFYTNSKTFDQMKASGMLKLIEPRNLLDSLGFYYVTFQLLAKQDDLVRLKQDEVHKGNYALFDAYVFSQLQVDFKSVNRKHVVIKPPEDKPALLSTEYKTVNEVALNYYYLAAAEKFDCRAAETQKELALRLIELIKKEYHLENE